MAYFALIILRAALEALYGDALENLVLRAKSGSLAPVDRVMTLAKFED